jgi:glycosyltransferase involved in cell wall biosynthesis
MISVIIPAHNEQEYLNKTIDNFLSTAKGQVEVIVILNGYDQKVDKRAKVLVYKDNLGERVAMNTAAYMADGEYLLRIDGHCDVDEAWDIKMLEVFKGKPKAIAVAVLTAVDKKWNRIKGHWYGFCNLLPTMEEKHDHSKNNAKTHVPIEPNMAFTGCGFMIAKDFYREIGGADETLPPMGAIGPEFAIKAHLFGDGVFTRTDVVIGHIFDTGGYETTGVIDSRKVLAEKYGDRYEEIAKKFGDVEMEKGSSVDHRTVVVRREDTTENKDERGNIVEKIVKHYVYVYKDNGKGPTEEQIRKKYAPEAKFVGQDTYYPDQNGKLVKVA